MNLSVDLEKMKEVFGDEIIEIISDNMDIIEKNVQTLKDLNFDDVGGLFERCPSSFTYFPKDFNSKINKLIEKIGKNYVEVIQNDISYFENL